MTGDITVQGQAEIEQIAARRAEDFRRRRAEQSRIRAQLAAARAAGLRLRHARKERRHDR